MNTTHFIKSKTLHLGALLVCSVIGHMAYAETIPARFLCKDKQTSALALRVRCTTKEVALKTPEQFAALVQVNTGPTGPKGITGIQGERGPSGKAGAQGPAGPQGFQGLKGDTGAGGPKGPDGVAGPKGPLGPTGLQGNQGPQGDAGVSAESTILHLSDTQPGPTGAGETQLRDLPCPQNYFAFGGLCSSSLQSNNTVAAILENGSGYHCEWNNEGSVSPAENLTIKVVCAPLA